MVKFEPGIDRDSGYTLFTLIYFTSHLRLAKKIENRPNSQKDFPLFRHAAQKTEFLKRLGITHILNAAEGTRARTVNTGKVILILA